jgi:hypothetical protein
MEISISASLSSVEAVADAVFDAGSVEVVF